MRGMRLPPSVHVVLKPSRTVALGVGIAALGTVGVALALPLPWWQQLSAVVAIAAWAFDALRVVAVRRGRRAVSEVRLAPDLILVATMGDGRLVAGHLRSSSYVSACLTTIVWRPDGARLSRTILVAPDMLTGEDFRRLRVMLRYARNAVAQGLPASQS